METLWIVLTAIAAYLIGSVHFAVVFSRVKHVDIRSVGSKNPGTMNVLRSVGKLWGALTFACDALKGVIFALLGLFVVGKSADWAMLFGLCAVLGHVFPILRRFRGGKGVATSMGVFLVVCPWVGLVVLALLIAALFLLRYGFIGSLVAITVMSVTACVTYRTGLVIGCAIAMWAIVVFAHRGNIVRLIRGTENTLDLTKRKTDDSAQSSETADPAPETKENPESESDSASVPSDPQDNQAN